MTVQVTGTQATGTKVTLVPTANLSIAITSCTVSAADNAQYFDDHVRGGIQIQSGGSLAGGTLGFLATTAATPQDPQGKVVAVTCLHVVCPSASVPSNLTATVNATANSITLVPNGNPIPVNTLIQVAFGDPVNASIYYTTRQTDSLNDIAVGIVSAVTQSQLSGVLANNAGSGTVAFTLPPQAGIECAVFRATPSDAGLTLTADISGSQLNFSGDVSSNDWGIYTNVNAGGLKPTCGVFSNPTKDDTPTTIAQSIAKSFNLLGSSYRGSVMATPTGSSINFANAESVECIIRSDVQVGQPDNSFASTCSHCCSHRIGRVIDARKDGDIAIIQLDSGQKWVPEIQGIGVVSGTHFLEASDLHLPVVKRGRTMPEQVWGMIELLQVSGVMFGEGGGFDRNYVNAIQLKSENDHDPFALPGDSGAAICDVLGGVIGVVFGGADLIAWATSMNQIVDDDFPNLELNVAPAPEAGHAPGDVRTVPNSAMAALPDKDLAATNSPTPFLATRLAQVQEEISATPAGSQYVELVKRHFAESQRLVNSNRRVATVWHRNGGPQMLNAFLRMLQRRDEPLPQEIDGKPFVECLERIRRSFARYASPALATDLLRVAPRVASFAGLTYTQILAGLRSQGSGD